MELAGEHLLTKAGGPVNYSMKTFEPDRCRMLAEMSLCKSRYIALLTSLHMDFLYRKEAARDPVVKDFLGEQKLLRKKWCKELGIKNTELNTLYSILEWCDACSLLLCQRQLPPEQRGVGISAGPHNENNVLVQLDDEQLAVRPWPFNIPRFPISYEYRVIPALRFSSSADFRKAFLAAPVSVHTWTLINDN
jgi:Protein of unknown function (DUF3891)